MSESPVAVISGANRGLGLETCRQLAERGYRVVLGSRDPQAGESAAASLREQGLAVESHALDVDDDASIAALAETLGTRYGRVDVLVNNAGVFPDPPPGTPESSVFAASDDTLRRAFETNTLGAWRLCRALVPLMRDRGRIVNVSSGMGQLSDMNGHCPGYRLSKTALNALTRILADELADTAIKVNSVCPGWVRTRMGGDNATLSTAEGAAGIVWAATLDDDGPSGGFFRSGVAIPW
jgi:NAD(P)-dependent dehydrogenase (short-subunit alcohol dehydrogenase family)